MKVSTTSSSSLLLTLTAITMTAVVNNVTAQPFDGCDLETYYAPLVNEFGSDPTSWTKEAVQSLLESTHQNVLPIQKPGSDDVYTALIDLWPGDEAETVHLVNRDISYPATPYANSQSWSRGNVWPEDRRTGFSDGANTDIHANVPADTTVFASKGVLQFGLCGTVQVPELCRSLPEATETQTDEKIWEPPESARGSQARMAMYLATRYNGELSDCPPFDEDTLAYRSQLLDWHAATMPTTEEQTRNTQACERWQGNRNVFVDYPQLAETFFGTPDTLREGYRAYEQCFDTSGMIATMPPTASPNACQDLEAGDVQLILENSQDPDQMTFFTLDRVPHAVESLYVTDRPWNGTHLVDNGEGTLMLMVPPETTQPSDGQVYNGMHPGFLFAYGFDKTFVEWTPAPGEEAGSFSLNETGDTILTYCIDADGDPRFLHGFTFAEGGWAEAGLSADEYGEGRSALPDDIKSQGSVAVPNLANYIYNGTTSARKDELLLAYANPNFYVGSDEVRWDIEELKLPSTSGGAAAGDCSLFATTMTAAALSLGWWLLG